MKLSASNWQNLKEMNNLENDFARVVREHKGTIYTVCYMFSKDEDEVADLFQDILINLWKGLLPSVFPGIQGLFQ